MKNIITLLALALWVGFANPASAQSRPKVKVKAKRAFSHRSETSKGKTNKAQFRHEGKGAVIDLHPGKPGQFKTARANKPYKYSKGL